MKFGPNSRDGVDLAMLLHPELCHDDGDDDDLFIRETTPPKVTADIIDFCIDIGAGNPPTFIAVQAAQKARAGWCFKNVADVVAQHGGEAVNGWALWGVPGLFYTAEFHSVWRQPQGDLLCVTPKPDGERTVLFLPDKRYGPAFDFFKRPSNLRMRVYGLNWRRPALYAKIAELSEARRKYEIDRAARQGLTLMQSIGSRFAPRDNLETFIDDFLKNVGVLENMLAPTPDGLTCKDPRLQSEFHRRALEVGRQKAKLFLMVDLMVRGAVPIEKE